MNLKTVAESDLFQKNKKLMVGGAAIALTLVVSTKLKPIANVLGLRTEEEPRYSLLDAEGTFETRQYAPAIVAEVTLEENHTDFMEQGFQILADYIFGGNAKEKQMEMTAPVYQTRMTDVNEAWKMTFFMPRKYNLRNLPKPNDSFIAISKIGERKLAVQRFSGASDLKAFRRQTELLKNWMKERGLEAKGEPVLALYDPPFTLPFRRRNEIHIEFA